jgi:hypothetical protein
MYRAASTGGHVVRANEHLGQGHGVHAPAAGVFRPDQLDRDQRSGAVTIPLDAEEQASTTG